MRHVGVRRCTDLHVDIAFGYVNFVERVDEGGIGTIGQSRDIKEDKNQRMVEFPCKVPECVKQTNLLEHCIWIYQSL